MNEDHNGMKVEDLKNYGTNMHDLSKSVSKKEWKNIKKTMFSTVLKELGLFKSIKLLILIRKKIREFSKVNLDRIRKFCQNEEFLTERINDAAMFSAIQDLTDTQKAVALYKKILDEVFPPIGKKIYPNPDLIRQFDQEFDVVKKYILSIMDADKKEGLHDYEIVENTSDVLAFNVTRCAWFETKKELGVPEATIQDCYSDEASLPGLLEQVGIKFSRSQTIANGAKFCDFRFTRKK
jgi:hypothetical protein